MARVKPEVIYEPLAPFIERARSRGLSDDEIVERIERVAAKAREMGYSGGEIARTILSTEIREESKTKGFMRGLAESLSLGYYVPEALKQRPSEIPSGVRTPLGVEVSPEAAGEFVGGVPPFMGALKVARPAATLAQRVLGTGRAGRIGGEAARVGAATGLVEGAHEGTLEERAERVAIGVPVGGAVGAVAGIARQIAAARRGVQKPPPSEVVETEPAEFEILPPERVTRRQLAPPRGPGYEEPIVAGPVEPKAVTGRVGFPKALPAERLGGRRVQRALPPGPTGPRGEIIAGPSSLEATAALAERADAQVAEQAAKGIIKAEKAKPRPAGKITPEQREEIGLGKPAPERHETVRLPEESNVPSVTEMLDRKGLVFRVDRSVKDSPYTVVAAGGETKRFRRLTDVVAYADTLQDDVRPSVIARVMKGGKLSEADRSELAKLSATRRRKVANEPQSVETDPRLAAQPPEPPPIAGGADVPTAMWLQRILHLRGLGKADDLGNFTPNAEGSKVANAIASILRTHPELEAELRLAFEQARPVSFNPLDFIGQPTRAMNRVVSTVAREASEVEMAWDFESKRWAEYFAKHFANLTDTEAGQAARVIEGELKPRQVTETVRKAADAWRTAASDFARRLGVPEWAEYLTRLTDMQAVYEQWKPHILAAKRFEDLSETMRFKIGSEQIYKAMVKAFGRQEKWENLPRDVKGWFKERLLEWHDMAPGWESIPEFVRSRVPKEVFDRFLLPRTGGLPFERDVRKSFQAYVPVALRKMHVDPLLDKWGPVVNHLPGRANNPLSEGHYLSKYLDRFVGKESVGLDRLVDGVVRSVENSLGKMLADPNLASRIASRAASWTYRGALGVDSAVVNASQSINTWAESGTTHFLRGLSRYIAGEAKHRPDVGLLREFGDIYAKGEFATHAPERLGSRRLADLDEQLTRLALKPMNVAEHINRGVAFLSGMEEAAAMKLDATQAIRMGFARASRVVPNLELTRAQWNAIQKVASTQYGYSPAFRSPYLAGPLARLSTIFWSYPTKQLQFVTDGMAEGLKGVMKQPTYDNTTRLLRFSALAGLMVGGAALGAKVGLNLENVFGIRGILPRAFAGPIGVVVQMYNLSTTGKPLRPGEVDQAWNNALSTLVPQYRYGRKVLDARDAAQRGFRTDELGRQTYRTTPYGEFMRALGVDYGQAYREKVAARTIMEENARRLDTRASALRLAIEKNDFTAAERYNQTYPEMPLTERDLQQEMRLRATPLVERVGPLYLRRRVADEEQVGAESMGSRP